MSARVLVIDDDSALAEMIGIVLRGEGFEPTFCADGSGALQAFREHQPDVVLLDVMLPGKDGIEVCQSLRAESGVPIVMLTARSDTTDVVRGLESGADDYIVKPFNPNELVARVRARLRPLEKSAGTLQLGDITIHTESHEVFRNGEPLSLTPLEFNLLTVFASSPGKMLSREVLLQRVWGYQYQADTRLVNVHVQRLRAKIEHDPDNPKLILTQRGVGYRAVASP